MSAFRLDFTFSLSPLGLPGGKRRREPKPDGFVPFSPHMSLSSLAAQAKCQHFAWIFTFSLSPLGLPGGKRRREPKPDGFVPFSPHMSPKTDGKPKQSKSLLMPKASFEKRALLHVKNNSIPPKCLCKRHFEMESRGTASGGSGQSPEKRKNTKRNLHFPCTTKGWQYAGSL